MAKSKMKRKRAPKSVLKLPDLEQSKSAVLNSLTSPSSQRTYDHAIREFIEWYCSEPRLAFNKTVVTRYRISLEQHAESTGNPVTVYVVIQEVPEVNWGMYGKQVPLTALRLPADVRFLSTRLG